MTVGVPSRLPIAYHGWVATAGLSAFGDAALYFALGWAAAGIGPGFAGLVLTMVVLPRTVLLLVGGTAGDRFGPRRVLLAGQVALCAATVVLAIEGATRGVTASLLVATAVAVGVIEAFCLPCLGSFPRLFVPDDLLARAMAVRASTNQVVTMAAAPVGGALVALAGLPGAAVVDAVTFAVSVAVLAAIRPAYEMTQEHTKRSVVREIADGVRVAVTDRGLRTMLVATGLVAAFVLPMTSLCLPLLARERHAGPGVAGMAAGAAAAGVLAVSLVVARRGPTARPGRAAGLGPVVAGLGMAGVAAAPQAMVGFAVVQGLGIGVFVAHVGPMFAAATPRAHLTRLQSILSLVQVAPLLVANNVLGAIAAHRDARTAAACCALGTAMAGLLLLGNRRMRSGMPS